MIGLGVTIVGLVVLLVLILWLAAPRSPRTRAPWED